MVRMGSKKQTATNPLCLTHCLHHKDSKRFLNPFVQFYTIGLAYNIPSKHLSEPAPRLAMNNMASNC